MSVRSNRAVAGAGLAGLVALVALSQHHSPASSSRSADEPPFAPTELAASSLHSTSTCYPANQTAALRHRVQSTPTGLVTGWTFASRPDAADGCEVTLTIDGARGDAPGHFRFPSGNGVALGAATLIDARGIRTQLEPTLTAAGTSYGLSAGLLAATEFPAVLDPAVSPEVEASMSVNAAFGNDIKLASDGTRWLAAAGFYGSRLALLDSAGQVLEQAPGPVGLQDVLFTDQFVLLTRDGLQHGHSLAELNDGGRITFPVSNSFAVAVGSPGSLLVITQVPAGDGGPELEFDRIGNDFSWDGGGARWPTASVPYSATLEGATVYVTYLSPSLAFRVVTATAGGLPQGDLLLRDGGPFAAQATYATDGLGTTLLLWNDYGTGSGILHGLIAHGGAAGTDPIRLATGLADEPVATWDGTAFRVVYTTLSPPGLSEVRLFADGGLVGQPTQLLAQDGGRLSMPHLSAGAARTLLSWVSLTGEEYAGRVTTLQNGVSTALDGGAVLFRQPNGVTSPSVTSRGAEVLAAWNDDRVGGGFQELWVRPFTASLVPLDTDAHTTTPPGNRLGFAGGRGPRAVCATDTGHVAVFANGVDIVATRLDGDGRLVGPELPVTTSSIYDIWPTVACAGSTAMVLWFNAFDVEAWFSMLPPDGGVGGRQSLGSGIVVGTAPLGADVAVFTNNRVSRVDPSGTVTALPIGPFPNGVLSVSSDQARLLVVKAPPAWPGTVVASLYSTDGGAGPDEPIYTSSKQLLAQAAWDGRRFSIAMMDDTDGGTIVAAWRRDDGGWSTPAPLGPPSNYAELAVAAVADAGLAVAFTRRDFAHVWLQRVQWFDDGTPCGAASDCLSDFCVDGVCCDSACGGGAVDCLACSVAKGAAADGVCRALPANAVCRAALSGCDLPETCDGVALACPPDAVADAGLTCRAAVSSCDVEERCDGTTGTCPADVTLPDTTPCDGGVCGSGICGGPIGPTVTITAPGVATCLVSQTVFFTVQPFGPHPVQLSSSLPTISLDADAGTFSWTPTTAARGGDVELRADGGAPARVTLTSDCAPTRYAVGCGCGSAEGAAWLVLALAWLRRRTAR